MQCPVEVDRRFCMDGQYGRARIGEIRDVSVGIRDHQMHVQRKLGYLPDRSDDWGTNCNVGHKMSIHYIDVQQMGARLFHLPYVFPKRCKVCREDGGLNANAHWLTSR